MVDELNITIEEFSNTTTGSGTTAAVEENTVMNSTEQAVKYAMDKASLEDSAKDFNIQDTEIINDELNTNSDINNNTVSEDVTEITEDLIANSDITDSEEITNNSTDTEDSNTIINDVETNTSEESSTSEHNTFGNSDKKENMKQTQEEQNQDSNFDDIVDADIDVNTTHTKNIHVAADTSGKVSSMSGINSTVSLSQTTASSAQNANITKDDIIAQIHSKLQALNSTNNTKLTMVLNPESLGKVQVQLTNTDNGMVAEFSVASQHVKDLLDSNLTQLKDTLSAQGVHVNDVSVKVSHSENNAQMDYTEQESSDSNKQNPEDQQKHQNKEDNKFEEMFLDSKDEQDKE